MLIIDGTANTGFSEGTVDGADMDGEDIANVLIEALELFYDKFPEYSDNDFYIYGQSIGGTYAPYLTWHILD